MDYFLPKARLTLAKKLQIVVALLQAMLLLYLLTWELGAEVGSNRHPLCGVPCEWLNLRWFVRSYWYVVLELSLEVGLDF